MATHRLLQAGVAVTITARERAVLVDVMCNAGIQERRQPGWAAEAQEGIKIAEVVEMRTTSPPRTSSTRVETTMEEAIMEVAREEIMAATMVGITVVTKGTKDPPHPTKVAGSTDIKYTKIVKRIKPQMSE